MVTANRAEQWHGAMVPSKFEKPPLVAIVTDEQTSLPCSLSMLKDNSWFVFGHARSALREAQRDLLLLGTL